MRYCLFVSLIFISQVTAIELPDGLSFCQTSHGNFIIRSNDQHIGYVLASGRLWESQLIEKCLEMIPPNSVVIDIGANVGTHTISWSKKAGKVFSFEPQRIIFQQLCANIVINGLQNVYASCLALGHKNCECKLDATVPPSQGFSSERPLSYEPSKTYINFGGVRLGKDGEEIEMRTLDSFQFTNVSLIKVDVEGAEPLVFYGARETIRKNKPILVYEKRDDLKVTQDMIEILDVSKTIENFDVEKFVFHEFPDDYLPPLKVGEYDFILIPKNT